MDNHSVTIELPDDVFQRLSQLAEAMNRPVAEVVAQSFVGIFSPEIDLASSDLRPELLKMQFLSDAELLSIAQAVVTAEQQSYHEDLLAKNAANSLNDNEREELVRLRSMIDRQMLCKAHAWSILRWRGHRVPTLAEIPG
jgi:hypothetical protein